MEDRAEGGRPKEAPPKTTKPPPVTQEGDEEELDADEEEPDDEDREDGREDGRAASNDAKLPAPRNLDCKAKLGGRAADWTEGGRPKKSLRKFDKDDEELDDDEEANFEANRAHGAAGDAAARRWTDDVAVRARAALAWEPRGHPPANVVRPDQPYDVAARALAALKDDDLYRNPKLVRDHEDWSDGEEIDDGEIDDD